MSCSHNGKELFRSFIKPMAPTAAAPSSLFLSALRTKAMRHPWRAAILADEQSLFLHGQMRPATAHLAMRMMFHWYASHSGYSIKQGKEKNNPSFQLIETVTEGGVSSS
jgi:hypothetical protein